MRLTRAEVQAIKDAVGRNFGSAARVLLFGSRVDDTRRGGDIEILVEHDPAIDGTDLIRKKLRTMSDIQFALGDQKVDIATAPLAVPGGKSTGQDEPLAVRNARKEGIPL